MIQAILLTLLATYTICLAIIIFHKNYLKKQEKGTCYKDWESPFLKLDNINDFPIRLNLIWVLTKYSIKQQILIFKFKYGFDKTIWKIQQNIEYIERMTSLKHEERIYNIDYFKNNLKNLNESYMFFKEEMGFSDDETEERLKKLQS